MASVLARPAVVGGSSMVMVMNWHTVGCWLTLAGGTLDGERSVDVDRAKCNVKGANVTGPMDWTTAADMGGPMDVTASIVG